MSSGPLEVLIVEDNPGDVLIISDLLNDASPTVHITIAKDGQTALNILRKDDGSDAPAPDFVILDLNLPRVKGFDVLAYMKKTPALQSVPVVIMTGSLKKEDEIQARSMGAADYCIKPSTVEEMETSMTCLRGHLGSSSQNKGKGKGHEPSSTVIGDLQWDVEHQRFRPPWSERPITDVFNYQPWNMWK
jgi:two-component system, chemotaxis family, response regulator Rcp1